MKDFEKINWAKYNRPPYYQQWMCTDDTLKLAKFGDRGLAEIDGQILLQKDLWDLDNIKGPYLDRIGKLLNEKRNGCSDDFYRKILKLRILLNTNDGTIPSIIKAIKFLYSSEVVHIIPKYPAGLIILHDGEGTEGINFNKILNEVIPAGVGYETRELYRFVEKMTLQDSEMKYSLRNSFHDDFDNSFTYGVDCYDGSKRYGPSFFDDLKIEIKQNCFTYGIDCYDGSKAYGRIIE